MLKGIMSMPDKIMTSRWAAQIIGHKLDLLNLASKLNDSILSETDIFISMIGNSHCLRSKEWDGLELQAVKGILPRVLATIRGCLDSLDGCASLEIGTIFELDAGGNILNRTRDSKFSAVILPKQADRASPAKLRQMINTVEQSKRLQAATAELEPFAGWYSIYKSVEACLGVWGGAKNYAKSGSQSEAYIERVKQTANWYRHASVTFDFPKKPVTLQEAQIASKKMIIETVAHMAGNVSGTASKTVRHVIPDNIYPGQRMAFPARSYGGAKGFEVGVVGEEVNWAPTETFDD